MRAPALTLTALACCVGLFAAGCGGGDGAGSAETISRAEVVKRADAICAEADAASAKVTQPSDTSDLTQAATYFKGLLAPTRRELERLRSLKPDAAAKSDLGALVSAIDAGVADLAMLSATAQSKNATAVQELLGSLSERAMAVQRAAERLGAQRCAGAQEIR